MVYETNNIRTFLKSLRDHKLEPYDQMDNGKTVAENANEYLCMKVIRQKTTISTKGKTWNQRTDHSRLL
jgi:hypothetical protein